ncbi:Iron-sulfur cluster insertion protein ErpA [bioreactor metagenome]|uniref:Iron-sulfur cluster insertion protein ErpA n=1 Tax=bioreactor metagenome TaxID=1076179 RepID=A0A645GHD4_9ZZZZ
MSITVDKKASDELKSILSEKNINTDTLRIFLSGMGSSGPMFNLAQDEAKDSDLKVEFEGLNFVVDKTLVSQYDGFEVLYVEQGDMGGVYVQALNVGESSGCSSCSGCS